MNAYGLDGKYASISQRVAATYLRMLSAFCPVAPAGVPAAQADLHAFFSALYGALSADPGRFGLPVTEDVYLLSDHGKEGPDKSAVKRLLDKPRKLIEDGLDFLRSAGDRGQADGPALALDARDPAAAYLKKKPGRAFAAGLERIGLSITETGGPLLLESARFPAMMPALQELARACAGCADPNLGRVFFARCDFRALGGDFTVDAQDLFGTLSPEDCARAAEMHAYYTARGYQCQVTIEHMHQWDVRYQGKKSVKASPLFQVIYDERLLHPMRAQIKIASAPRVAALVEKASPALQDDFARRLYPCQDCGWCSKKKGLQHPMLFARQGKERKVCWYVNPDVDALTDEAVSLVKEYTRMHEALEA